MRSRRRKAASRRLCTCERLTWEHHLLRALPGGKQKPTQEGSTRLATSYKAFTTARVSAATRRTSSCCSTTRSCSYLHPLSQARCYLHPLHFDVDGKLPPCCSSSTARSSIPWLTTSSSIPYDSTSTTSKVSSFCTFAAHLFCTICFSLLAAAALCFALFQHIIDHLEACVGCSLICYCNWLIAKLLPVVLVCHSRSNCCQLSCSETEVSCHC
jgi:hypothetical protein